jgi:hypothetical protein
MSGCGSDDKIRQYREKKNSSPTIESPAPERVPVKSKLIWNTPEGWNELTGSGFRLASFKTSAETDAAQCSIVVLQGDGGGITANVQRWMFQLDMIPLEGGPLDDFVAGQETFKTVDNRPGILIDLSTMDSSEEKKTGTMIMASMVFLPHETVFIKMVGSPSVCKQNRDKLFSLSRSLRGS